MSDDDPEVEWTPDQNTEEAPTTDGWDAQKRESYVRRTLVKAERIIKETIPIPGFLIEDLIPALGIVVLTGEPGAGKSWIAYDLIRAITTGTPWMVRSKPACDGQPRPVILFNYDTQVHELQRRFRRLGMTGEEPFYVQTPEFVDPKLGLARLTRGDTAGRDWVCALVEETQAALVIFDSMRQSHTADEDSNLEMADIMCQFKAICQPLRDRRCTVMLLHHTAKSMKTLDWRTKGRGSGEIAAQADVMIHVEPTKVTWNKVRGWSMPPNASASYKMVDGVNSTKLSFTGSLPGITREEETLNGILFQLQRGPEGGLGKRELRQRIGSTMAVVGRAIILGVERGLLERPRRVGAESSKMLVALTGAGKEIEVTEPEAPVEVEEEEDVEVGGEGGVDQGFLS